MPVANPADPHGARVASRDGLRDATVVQFVHLLFVAKDLPLGAFLRTSSYVSHSERFDVLRDLCRARVRRPIELRDAAARWPEATRLVSVPSP